MTKDLLINDLLSATELDMTAGQDRTAVQSIFYHLRKIRNIKCPIQRSLTLVEAISRDVSSSEVVGYKKKRDEHLKMVRRVNISRKWLQERIHC